VVISQVAENAVCFLNVNTLSSASPWHAYLGRLAVVAVVLDAASWPLVLERFCKLKPKAESVANLRADSEKLKEDLMIGTFAWYRKAALLYLMLYSNQLRYACALVVRNEQFMAGTALSLLSGVSMLLPIGSFVLSFHPIQSLFAHASVLSLRYCYWCCWRVFVSVTLASVVLTLATSAILTAFLETDRYPRPACALQECFAASTCDAWSANFEGMPVSTSFTYFGNADAHSGALEATQRAEGGLEGSPFALCPFCPQLGEHLFVSKRFRRLEVVLR